MKLRSCMTLFALAAPDEPVFRKVLDRYFGGEPDGRTLDILGVERERFSWFNERYMNHDMNGG